METTVLRKEQIQQAAGVFYRAFRQYPQMLHYFPNEQLREKYLEWYLGCVLRYAYRYGDIHTNPAVTGFACWIPPEHHGTSMWGAFLSGFFLAPLRFGIKEYGRVLECEEYTGSVHKKLMPAPHYYVWGLAVEPGQQGRGIGGQLLRPGLERAASKGLPVYLETHDVQNIRFYEKQGFEMICEDRVPGQNLPFWCFERRPK